MSLTYEDFADVTESNNPEVTFTKHLMDEAFKAAWTKAFKMNAARGVPLDGVFFIG